MKRGLLSRICTCLVLACVSSSTAFAVSYTYHDLGTLGGLAGRGMGINASGQIAGYSGIVGESSHPFVYTPGGSLTDLGTIGGGNYSGRDINSSGQVLGDGFDSNGVYHKFVYTPGVGMEDLGTDFLEVYGINDSGKVVGTRVAGMDGQRASVYTPGVGITTLGVLGSWGGPGDSRGRDINASGQVTGISSTNAGDSHAFLYTPGSGMIDLGTPGDAGYYSEALGMNDSGQVVGYYMQLNHDWRGFLYTPGGSMIDIGTIGGDRCIPNDVNNQGWVVGTSLPSIGWAQAFVRDPSGNELQVLPSPGGSLTSMANGINDNGWITGMVAYTDGSEHVALWTPVVPEPSSLLALSGGLLGMIGFLRRRK